MVAAPAPDPVTAALRESEERFRLLVDGVADYAIYMLDPVGKVVSWNKGAQRLKGYTAEEVLGQDVSMFFVPEDAKAGKPRAELERAAAEGRTEQEAWRLRKDGSRFWASVVVSALRDDSGNLRGYAKVTRDMTARKAADDRLRAYATKLERSNRELETFAAVASHDLQEPLRKIRTFGDRLATKEGDKLGPDGRDYLERMRSAAARMQDLIESHPETKVLCMSGYTDDSIVRHGVLDARIAFLQKPFTPEMLAGRVRDVIDRGVAP